MPTILGVRIDDKLLELSSPESEKFGRFFNIDSVNLLLGKNGSGKTRFLLALANAIADPEGEAAQFYFNDNAKKLSENSGRRQDICAIYYTALPYKRKLSRRVGVIDASPRTRDSDHGARLIRLGEVAAALGIQTKLTGFFGYSRKVYRSVLIPALLRASKIHDPDLEDVVRQYSEFNLEVESLSGSIKDADDKRENIIRSLEELLELKIDHRLSGYDRTLYLTALEYMIGHADKSDVASSADAFLAHLGLARNKSVSEHFEALEELTERTREALSNYADPDDFDDRDRVHYFQIDGISQLSAIRRYETPIRIEWSNLSSGLQALVEQFSLIGEAVGKAAEQGRFSVLLLIDEGDAYLHLDWQRRYLALLNQYLGDLKRSHGLHSLQLILATHSPLLAADLPGEFVTNLDSGTTMKTFAAPLEEVIAGSFESSSLGEFAAIKINEIYRRVQQSKLTETDRNVINAIGDLAIRSALMKGVD